MKIGLLPLLMAALAVMLVALLLGEKVMMLIGLAIGAAILCLVVRVVLMVQRINASGEDEEKR